MIKDTNTSIKKFQNKDLFFQVIRAICILAVVLIHLKQGSVENNTLDYWVIFRRCINFPVAIFFFLSGYFVKTSEIERHPLSFLKKRVTRLIIPLFIWSFIYGIFNDISIDWKFPIKVVLGNTSSQLYYVIVLIQLTFITPILVKLINKKNKKINLLLLLISPIFLSLLYYVNITRNINIVYYNYIFCGWFIFYYLGMHLQTYDAKISNYKTSMLFGVILLSLSLSLIESYLLQQSNTFLAYAQLSFGNLVYSLSLILLILNLKNKIQLKKQNILVDIGNLSFGIYFIHMLFIPIVNEYLYSATSLLEYVKYQIIAFFIISLVSYILCKTIHNLIGSKHSKYLGLQ